MSRTTGPVLAIGAITVVNRNVVNGAPWDWRVPIATGIAAGAFALIERGWERGAVALSYLALVAVIFTRLNPGEPAPAEAFVKWWNEK